MQHVQDGEADVEADEVGERQRPHRVIHPELHHRVDRLRRADAFHHREDRLVDHRHQDAVRDEARVVGRLDRRLAERRAQVRRDLSSTSSDVAWPRISSTSVISGTGFMKCMPSTLSGRFVAAPSAVIEIDDVFDERIDVAAW